MNFECQNCVKIQKCDKSHYHTCKDFELYGEIPKKPRKSKELCYSCYNNYYNQEKKGCWSYKSAKVTLQSYPFHLNHSPPWQVRYKLSCFIRKW